jgi:methylmalonyl-CoA mutase N-terminal domain/subunit
MAKHEIGKVGVSLASLDEMELLFEEIDISKVSTSFTINGTAAILYAMYCALADRQRVPRAALTGTIQNDILKEYVARGTWIFPIRPSMRLIADTILFANKESPRFNPISIAGAHMRDAGCTAVEEMGYTLANGLAYVDELIQRGGQVDEFAHRLSFFFYVHMDLFEEICKFRAGRRVWAKFMRQKYGALDPKSEQMRFGVVCGGSSLVAPQPYNNIVRVTIETMAAVMGGAQSIFTCAFDEAYQIPTEFSAETALRTQQIIAYESGVSRSVDPLGGSYLIEHLTDRMEQEIVSVIEDIERYGGVQKAIEDGWLQGKIAERALQRKRKIDSHETVVVGQNEFVREDQENAVTEVFRQDTESARRILDRHRRNLDQRDSTKTENCLRKLGEVASMEDKNLLPYLIECCHVGATVGEMVGVLKTRWGEFQEPLNL